jgi:5-bromo-4-chloroindolyl phosphate hydrolysis protein
MVFNNSKGNERYILSAYGWNVEDKYIYDDLQEAEEKLERLKAILEKGIALSIYDGITGERVKRVVIE